MEISIIIELILADRLILNSPDLCTTILLNKNGPILSFLRKSENIWSYTN